MKSIVNSKYLLSGFLILVFIINIIQGYTTELLSDEAYYWTYSNFLDWGYFDHPPMVAIWITISKFFFSTGELSVRFFSSITLPISFYFVWLLIDHPKKKEFTWLFILITFSTALFNAYGAITVPDTPLMFFTALFLVGYKKYLKEKSLISYIILAISMAAMMYSKYQAILVIGFVLLSNLKVLKDGKIWLTTLATLLLFSPHLLWQFENDFPSFKYHLFERKENTVYRFRDTYMHLINMIAIIGFTFPIVYKALLKNLKNKDLFQKALNFIVVGFIVFFFISTFKGHAQAQWIVPISIPLIVIPFNYLIEHPEKLKLFKTLAIVSIVVITFLRIAMANDGILPKQFEMHANKNWVNRLDDKIGEKTPLFINSYQNTSLYWFYSGKRPYQINAWTSRKNQYDLYNYNQNFSIKNPMLIGVWKQQQPTDSMKKKKRGTIYLKDVVGDYQKSISFKLKLPSKNIIKQNSTNSIPVLNKNLSDSLKKFTLQIVLKSGTVKKVFPVMLQGKTLTFSLPKLEESFIPELIQIIGTPVIGVEPIRLSSIEKCIYNHE